MAYPKRVLHSDGTIVRRGWILDGKRVRGQVGGRAYNQSMVFKEAIRKRDGYRCQTCGCTYGEQCDMHPFMPVVKLDVSHIVPHADGGPSTPDNLRTLCHGCNLREGRRRKAVRDEAFWASIGM